MGRIKLDYLPVSKLHYGDDIGEYNERQFKEIVATDTQWYSVVECADVVTITDNDNISVLKCRKRITEDNASEVLDELIKSKFVTVDIYDKDDEYKDIVIEVLTQLRKIKSPPYLNIII